MKIILASQSPRRRELLGLMGLTDFEIRPARGEEDMSAPLTPDRLVESLAAAKGAEVAAQADSSDVVIAADTIVTLDGKVLGKPRSAEEAFQMLRTLSGRTHVVYTGVVVIQGERRLVRHEATEVAFRPLTDEEILHYIATGEPMDKAGAYGIQGRGALLIEGIRGDYFNVMGLPVCRLGQMLREFGIATL
ncbi:MAG: septum formation inhibitor Maf [Oscillospiraceae bacterium]|nr:septum formation inhibitor Maf [Oscillospiraceae bacterium]